MSILSWSITSLAIFLAVAVHYRKQRRSIRDIRGPPSPSHLFGHEIQIGHQKQTGDHEFAWARDYGPTWRSKGCFGEDILWTADPKALRYIFHTSGYQFPKTKIADQNAKNIVARGLPAAKGDVHRRQRKIMTPAFSTERLTSFLEVFQRSAARLSYKWKDELQSNASTASIINVPHMLSRMTLDIIGETAFDYTFGALEDQNNELANVFKNLFFDTVIHPHAWNILFKTTWSYIPESILHYVIYLPTHEYRRFRHFLSTAFHVGKQLVDEKAANTEKGAKDIMSILIKSNLSEDVKHRLTEDEVLSQITAILVAGHDTTASTLGWALYALSKHPEDQRKLREEIATARKCLKHRGGGDFTISDLDGMPMLNAVIKETLRFHPIVPALSREAGGDDIIPLSETIETVSGKVINAIPVRKGQRVDISICVYNRLQSIWGQDADIWNPWRFLEDANNLPSASLGVIANIMTFSAGIRGCIGWKFAMLEMQAVLTELIEVFEFSIPVGVEIVTIGSSFTSPVVKGEEHKGVQIPLHVSLVQ